MKFKRSLSHSVGKQREGRGARNSAASPFPDWWPHPSAGTLFIYFYNTTEHIPLLPAIAQSHVVQILKQTFFFSFEFFNGLIENDYFELCGLQFSNQGLSILPLSFYLSCTSCQLSSFVTLSEFLGNRRLMYFFWLTTFLKFYNYESVDFIINYFE